MSSKKFPKYGEPDYKSKRIRQLRDWENEIDTKNTKRVGLDWDEDSEGYEEG